MKKYFISGKEKGPMKQEEHCSVCNDGHIFDNDQVIRTDMLGAFCKEKGCIACETKYKVPYVVFEAEYDTDYGREIEVSDVEAFDNTVELTRDNKDLMALSVAGQFTKDLLTHLPDIKQDMVEFGETHLCLNHKFINSKPIKTAEGSFIIQICAVCKKCSVAYRGKTRRSNLTEIMNFLLKQSEEFSVKKKKALSDVTDVPDFSADVFGKTKIVENIPEF